MIGGTGQTRLSVMQSGKSKCSLRNKLITKLNLIAGISAGLKGGPLCHCRSFPSSNSFKLNNLVLERVSPWGRGNRYSWSWLPVDPGANAPGMPVIQGEQDERGPARADKINDVCRLTNPLWVMPVCFMCTFFLSWPNWTFTEVILNQPQPRNVVLSKIHKLFDSSCVCSAKQTLPLQMQWQHA